MLLELANPPYKAFQDFCLSCEFETGLIPRGTLILCGECICEIIKILIAVIVLKPFMSNFFRGCVFWQ